MYFVLILLIALFFIFQICDTETYVASKVDNKSYSVLTKFKDQDRAANQLAKINIKNLALIEHLTRKYQHAGGTLGNVIAARLKHRYRPDRLRENDPSDKWNTSFTEDKGEVLALCLREKITGKNMMHDNDILEFVDFHELAHIASEEYGHGDEFWGNFKFLLIEAHKAKLHTPRNYSELPVNYCGLDVSYNPYFDPATTY